MTDNDEILLLNQLTGLVHRYDGTALGGNGQIESIPCGCDGFEEALGNNTLTVINPRHLRRGIWEPAECLASEFTDGSQ